MTSSTPDGVSYVYVIGSAGSTRVKIGTSVSPEKRLKELQTGNPNRLEVLWHTPGGRELEAQLHQVFAEYRGEGEWFDFGDVQPIGAIPSAVHQHVGTAPARSRGRSASKRAGTRAERGEHLITPERMASIVRDVVIGVVRPEVEPQEEDEDEVEAPVRKRRTGGEEMERLLAFMYRTPATLHAQRIVEGKKGMEALGGWLNLLILVLLAVVTLPVTSFLMLRVITRDIWPVRKLPMLVVVGYWLWAPLGLDKLIQDFVFSPLPMADIETFVRTYFTQAAVTVLYFLASCSPVACLIGYAQQVREHTEQQRDKAAEAKLKRQTGPRLDGAQLSTQAIAGGVALPKVGPPGAHRMPPVVPISSLIPSIPQQSGERADPSAPLPPR
ncbi:GIY-YIG nuclease family protein [Streptomyces sp. NPDC001553]|uniref:GIY-YIG nuclease family protein n=1 Tax=Streptomyces sp. NPDC001553 TaxID=3154385 RepID=UPI00332D2475